MGLFVRDECERSVKNQASNDELVKFMTSLQVARKKQLVKRPYVEHMIGRWRVVSGCQFHECFARKAIPRSTHESFCLATSCDALPISLSTL